MKAGNDIEPQAHGCSGACGRTTECNECNETAPTPPTASNTESEEPRQPARSLSVSRAPGAGLAMVTPAPIHTRPINQTERTAREIKRRKRFLFICASISLAGVLATAAIALLIYRPVRSRAASGPYEIRSAVSGQIPQPTVSGAKSLSDLKIGSFNLQKRRDSNLSIAVGDIENVSGNSHVRVRVDLTVIGEGGIILGTISDTITELPPHVVWHVAASTSDPAAVGVVFAGIKED